MINLDYDFPAESKVFLLAVLLGAVLGVVYDFIRIFRALFPHGKILTFVEDFLYMLLSGFALFTFSVGFSGEIRYFTVMGLIFGWLAEHFTIGNGIVFVFRKVGEFLRKKLFSPVIDFLAKVLRKIKSVFVRNKPKLKNNEKNDSKPLKVT